MVPRCGYYAENGVLVRKTAWIEWNLGFDREAKHSYSLALIEALNDVGPVCEITSASPFWETRSLSPLFVKMRDSDKTVEDYLQELNESLGQVFTVKGLSDMIYLQNLSQENIKVINKFKCFADVFANPNKTGFGNSQACSLGVYKVLEQLGKLDIINDNQKFMHWYNYEMRIELI